MNKHNLHLTRCYIWQLLLSEEDNITDLACNILQKKPKASFKNWTAQSYAGCSTCSIAGKRTPVSLSYPISGPCNPYGLTSSVAWTSPQYVSFLVPSYTTTYLPLPSCFWGLHLPVATWCFMVLSPQPSPRHHVQELHCCNQRSRHFWSVKQHFSLAFPQLVWKGLLFFPT